MWWSCDLMRCDCLCCVMSRDAMRCHVMCAHVMSCHLLCPAMEWNVMSSRCYWLWGHVVWFEVVLWQCGDPKYDPVLQRTTPVLLQFYSVLQRNTPVLLCTTKYYSSTTLYYSVQQSTTPVLLCTTKWHSWLILVTYEPVFSVRGATRVTLQLHQILRLPRKITLMIDPPLKLNVIYNAHATGVIIQLHQILRLLRKMNLMIDPRHIWTSCTMRGASQSPSNLTKYCACHLSWISWLIRVTYETSFTMRGASNVNLQPHQILRLSRNLKFKIATETTWIASANAKTIRPWSEDNPRIIRAWNRHASAASETLSRPILETHLHGKMQHLPLRLSPKVARNAVPATKSDTATSGHTTPAAQNESHDWSASHMQRLLPCAEQVKSPSTLSYCTLSYSSLSYSTLSYFTLRSATLSSCTLSYCTLSYCFLSYSTLSYSTRSYSILRYPTLSYCTLHYSTLS